MIWICIRSKRIWLAHKQIAIYHYNSAQGRNFERIGSGLKIRWRRYSSVIRGTKMAQLWLEDQKSYSSVIGGTEMTQLCDWRNSDGTALWLEEQRWYSPAIGGNEMIQLCDWRNKMIQLCDWRNRDDTALWLEEQKWYSSMIGGTGMIHVCGWKTGMNVRRHTRSVGRPVGMTTSWSTISSLDSRDSTAENAGTALHLSSQGGVTGRGVRSGIYARELNTKYPTQCLSYSNNALVVSTKIVKLCHPTYTHTNFFSNFPKNF